MMRVAGLLGVAAALGLLAPSAAASAQRDKVTGGGQILFSAAGPGSTIALTAQSGSSPADRFAAVGEVQITDREADGENETFHGTVDCLVATPASRDQPAMAEIGGFEKSGDPNVDRFTVFVEDNGEGHDVADRVNFDTTAEGTCDEDTDGETLLFPLDGRISIVSVPSATD